MKNRSRNIRMSDEASLQITSMADIFTIILVFLLKSYATSVVNIAPTSGMKIPEGQSLGVPVEALKVEVSQQSIQIENQAVTNLQDFRFMAGEVQSNLVSKSVSSALEIERKRQQFIAQSNSDVKVNAKILIIADQRTPYVTIKSVLASAAVNGFTDYKLVVVNKD